jgi:hypothetical protein
MQKGSAEWSSNKDSLNFTSTPEVLLVHPFLTDNNEFWDDDPAYCFTFSVWLGLPTFFLTFVLNPYWADHRRPRKSWSPRGLSTVRTLSKLWQWFPIIRPLVLTDPSYLLNPSPEHTLQPFKSDVVTDRWNCFNHFFRCQECLFLYFLENQITKSHAGWCLENKRGEWVVRSCCVPIPN